MAQVPTTHTHVLIVDDHTEVREGMRDLLWQGFPDLRIQTVADAEQALHAVAGHRFDVVLMDIALPGMGGLEAIRLMRPFLPAARFLVVSIHDGRAYRDSATAAGAAGFVAKRHLHDDLLATFGNLLDRCDGNPDPVTGAVQP